MRGQGVGQHLRGHAPWKPRISLKITGFVGPTADEISRMAGIIAAAMTAQRLALDIVEGHGA